MPITWAAFAYLIPYLISLAISAGVAFYASRWRNVVGARAYTWVALSQALWTLGFIFELLSSSLYGKIFWDDVQFLAGIGWFFGFFAFSLQYTGLKWPRPWIAWALFGILPAIFAVLVLTNKFHGMIRSSVWLIPGEPFSELRYDFTPMVWVWAIYGYGILIAGLVNLVAPFFRRYPLYRAQIATVVLGTLVPLIGTFLTFAGILRPFHRDVSPLMFALSNLIIAWGFSHFHMFDVVPIARYTVIDGMHDAIVVLDVQNRVVDLNAAARLLVDPSRKTHVIGLPVMEAFSQWSDLIARVIDVEQEQTEVTLNVGGGTRVFEFAISPLRDRVGVTVGRLITVRDISERLRFEASLQASEEKYRRLVESTADWVWTADLEGRNTYANAAVKQLLGYEVDEVVGAFVFSFMHPDDRAQIQTVMQNALRDKTGWNRMAVRWRHKDGSLRYFESTGQPVLNAHGDVIAFSGIDRDITERVQAENASRVYREQLGALVEARTTELTATLALLRRRDAILEAVSLIGERLLQTSNWHEEIDGMLAALGHATDVDRIVVYRGYIEAGVTVRVNIHYEWVAEGIDAFIADPRFRDMDVTEAGFRTQLAILMKKRPFYGSIATLTPQQRQFLGLWGVKSFLTMPVFVRNRLWGSISLHTVCAEREWDTAEIEALQTAADMLGATIERQETTQALELSRARLNQAQRIAHIGNWEWDSVMDTPFWSDEIYRIFGLAVQEVKPTTELFYRMVHPEDVARIETAVDQALRSNGTYSLDYRIVMPDGMVRTVYEQAEVTVDADDNSQRLMGVMQDITERKQIEIALQQSTERLTILHEIDRAILAAESSEAIAQVTLAHLRRVVTCPRMNITMLDSQAREIVVLVVDSDFETDWHAASRFPVTPQFEEIINTLQQGHEQILPADKIAQIPQLAQSYVAGVRYIILVPLVNRDGLIGSLNLLFLDGAEAEKVDLDVIREVANQLTIAMQQAQLHEQIRHHAEDLERRVAERTAELEAANRIKDEFVSNVSHELRTPITSLKLYHDLLVMRPDRFETYVATLKRETDRLNSLIENLLTLSRLDQNRLAFNIAPLDLNTIVEEYVKDRTPLATARGLRLTVEIVPGICGVNGDRNLLGQALSVLLTNAFNYTPPGGQVVLSTHAAQFDARVWSGFCVRDTGPGIPPEEHDRLFTRFYRGKVGRESGVSGTGLGLAIARKIVTQHRGRITLNSEGIPGKGATFCVWLPAEV